jgi:hypothetical protein
MKTSTGKDLAQGIRQKVDELKKVCEGIDEATAARAPSGRWSPKQLLSHLCGPEGAGHLPLLKGFLKGNTPTIDIEPENPFYSDRRAAMSFAELLAEVENEYAGIARFAGELTPEQLELTARVPQLKESPLGEYPTLGGMIGGLGQYHLQFHIDHLREILQEL